MNAPDPNAHLDERDREYLAAAQAAYDALPAGLIREGDAVRDVAGVIRRVAHVWNTDLDVTDPRTVRVQLAEGGRTFLGADGSMSYSGSLESARPFAAFADTGERHGVPVWFFHHNRWQGDNDVPAVFLARLWSLVPTPGTNEYVVRFTGLDTHLGARPAERVLTFPIEQDDPQTERLHFLIGLAAEFRLHLGRVDIETFDLAPDGTGSGAFTNGRGAFTITRA